MEPTDDADPILLDRWVIPLGEPADSPPPPPAPPAPSDPPPDLLRFPFDADVPNDEFQPRLIRFGKAG